MMFLRIWRFAIILNMLDSDLITNICIGSAHINIPEGPSTVKSSGLEFGNKNKQMINSFALIATKKGHSVSGLPVKETVSPHQMLVM